MRLIAWIISLWIITLPLTAIQAQGFKLRHYTIADGLSQSSVHCLLQDQQGLIWIGTEDGLNRFDGYQFRVFNQGDNLSSLPHNWVNSLYEDRQHYIWVGTQDGLSRLDPSTNHWTYCPIPRLYKNKAVR